MFDPDYRFPKQVDEVTGTITEVFYHQGRNEIVELLRSAQSRFDNLEYDNWNGGTYTWALRLEVPVTLYAAIERRLSDIEKEILDKTSYLRRLFPNDSINEVSITPIVSGMSANGQRMTPSEIEVRRLWPDDRFRLFLSHVSTHKIEVEKLKNELFTLGISAFVAHTDIEPSLEWRNEIELGLRSMNALAALITPDFHASHWTDQEIGWALGRGVAVVPIRLGIDPYGFAGKFQGIPGSLDKPAELTNSIVKALIVNAQTHGEMRRALARAFRAASTYAIAKSLSKIIVTIDDFTDEEKSTIREACTKNSQTCYVVDNIYSSLGKPPKPKSIKEDDKIPF